MVTGWGGKMAYLCKSTTFRQCMGGWSLGYRSTGMGRWGGQCSREVGPLSGRGAWGQDNMWQSVLCHV